MAGALSATCSIGLGQLDRKVKMRQPMGVALPFPHSSDLKGAKYPFRELERAMKTLLYAPNIHGT